MALSEKRVKIYAAIAPELKEDLEELVERLNQEGNLGRVTVASLLEAGAREVLKKYKKRVRKKVDIGY